jgi:DNA-binding response OmpR family regulator
MPSSRQTDLAEQLFETLEQCEKRLRAAREEVDSSLALVNLAMAGLTHLRSAGVLRAQLADLLQAQRAGIVQDIVSVMGSRSGAAAAGPFLFTLDPLQRAARIGRRRIPLTKAEFKLVECLWERRPQPASRQDLLDYLYGGDEDQPSDAVIDVIIFKIRQKLRNAGCTDASIEVVRGEGWFLNLDPALVPATDGEAAAEPAPEREEIPHG